MQEEKTNAQQKSKHGIFQQQSKEVWGARLRKVGTEVLWGCAAWLLGQAAMLFDTYPLGLGLLCAASGHTLSVLIGLLVTTVVNVRNPVLYACVYLAAALIRLIAEVIIDSPDGRLELSERVRKKLMREQAETERERNDPLTDLETEKQGKLVLLKRWWSLLCGGFRSLVGEMRKILSDSLYLRVASAAICALVLGLHRVITGGFHFYDWFAAVFVVVVASAVTVVYAICLEKRTDAPLLIGLSEGALLFSLAFSARTVLLVGFPLAPIIALFFTFYACEHRSAVQGVLASLLLGIAYAPIQAPAFLLAALTTLFCRATKRQSFVRLLPIAVMLAWSVYVSGAVILLELLPSLLIAAAFFEIAERVAFLEDRTEEAAPACNSEPDQSAVNYRVESMRFRDSNERFRGISDAFSSLSEVFYNLSDRFRRPGTLDLRRLCDRSFDRFCEDCPNKNVCWGLEYADTLGAVNELISQLHVKGRVCNEQIPAYFRNRCTRVEGILEEINANCAKLTAEMLRNNRTEIFAMDYESAADIINDALEEEEGEYSFDTELAKKIGEYLKDADVHAESVTVYGKRCRRVLIKGVDIDRSKVTFETMRSDLSEMCGSELAPPTFEVENGVSTMILQAKRKIGVIGAKNNVSADGGVSGDSINLFSNKKDYFYALISDGMGAGKEAALTSGLCSVFLEKMLRAGNRARTSLRMLNQMIASRMQDSTRECSSTVDLLELDLMTGEGAFIKSGAAPSFVVRGNVVRRLQAGTVPIGILSTLDTQKTRFSLRRGDVVVMISDGVLESDSECEWLTSYLSQIEKCSMEEIVYQICRHAADRETHDDCSAIALRIVDAAEGEELV